MPAAYVVIALTTIAAPFFLLDVGLQVFRNEVLGALTQAISFSGSGATTSAAPANECRFCIFGRSLLKNSIICCFLPSWYQLPRDGG
ncbi:hypothetical protein ACWGTI_31795 [Mesorhizobium sp. ArgA1]